MGSVCLQAARMRRPCGTRPGGRPSSFLRGDPADPPHPSSRWAGGNSSGCRRRGWEVTGHWTTEQRGTGGRIFRRLCGGG